MKRKLLIDTNVLLDAAMAERPEHAQALLLLEEVGYNEAEGYLCPLSLKDTYYILTKYATEHDARAFIKAALDLFSVVKVDYALCRAAAFSNEPDFEDGIVRACAEAVPVDFIISRDEAAFSRSPLKRLSAAEYIDLFTGSEKIELP